MASHQWLLDGLGGETECVRGNGRCSELVETVWNPAKQRYDITGRKEELTLSGNYPVKFGQHIVGT